MLKFLPLRCDHCRKNIVLGQQAQILVLEDGTKWVIHTFICKGELVKQDAQSTTD